MSKPESTRRTILWMVVAIFTGALGLIGWASTRSYEGGPDSNGPMFYE